MLTHVIGACWHALRRDVIALGYRAGDMFTTLDIADMVSIVVAAPPGSSVRHYLDGGWTRTDHLLANMQEQGAGVAKLESPYQRPGLEQRTDAAPVMSDGKFFHGEALDWHEAERRDAIRASGEFKHGPSRSRSISASKSVA